MEEGKSVGTNAVNHVIDLARTYLFPNVERACRPAVDGKIENAQIFPRTQEVAIDVIPIFVAIDFIALGGFDRENILPYERLFVAIRIVDLLRTPSIVRPPGSRRSFDLPPSYFRVKARQAWKFSAVMMFIEHQFNPHADLKRNSYGVLEFSGNKPDLERMFDNYLRDREEDSNIIG
jgi:hypothetical protein